jgi:hypothetical protein
MTTKHTPEPWMIAVRAGRILIQANNQPVAGVHAMPEQEANARLIAQAPAMRAIIERLIDMVDGDDAYPAVVDARAILARIDGTEVQQ